MNIGTYLKLDGYLAYMSLSGDQVDQERKCFPRFSPSIR